MKKTNKITTLLLLAIPCFALASCNSSAGEEKPQPEPEEPSVANPTVVEYKENNEGIDLVAPYTIYNESGEEVTLSTWPDPEFKPKEIVNTYDDLYRAIRVAGANSTTSKPLQVLDANFVQVFKRAKKTDNYLFQGKKYFGFAGQKTAKTFCLNHESSYAINGTGSDYYYLSRSDMVEKQTVTEESLEMFAGAYNYMFSNNGHSTGLIYASADVHLSECVYRPATDGNTWNAYIFINIAQGINADLGLIGTYNGTDHVCYWKLVRNCSSTYHATGTSSIEKDARFYVYQDMIATQSTKYNFETGECSGFDDLHFECLGQSWGWTLKVTNLRTNVTLTAIDHHHNADETDKTDDVTPQFGRTLIAASYCPVTLGVWNWDCGAKCTGVTWDHILTASALSGEDRDNIEAYRDESVLKYELYPGSEIFREGYAQGNYRSSHSFGVREKDGTYPSGIAYHAGEHYMIYNVNYND